LGTRGQSAVGRQYRPLTSVHTLASELPEKQPEASARVLAVVGFRCLADGQPENLIYRPGATAPEFLA